MNLTMIEAQKARIPANSLKESIEEKSLQPKATPAEYKSVAHEFAVTEYENSKNNGDSQLLNIAKNVAESMGMTSIYGHNPFHAEEQQPLFSAYEKGAIAKCMALVDKNRSVDCSSETRIE